MGEKVYKPIVKDGNHLIRSKDNPNRVRRLTRDENNQNPDIIEWEEWKNTILMILLSVVGGLWKPHQRA